MGNRGTIYKQSKVFLRENLNFHILKTEDRRRLKFTKAVLRAVKTFWKKTKLKDFRLKYLKS